MKSENFTFNDGEGVQIFTNKWSPDDGNAIKGIVQVAHGMAETGARYERFAKVLTENGYAVYVNDHRGHGKTAGSVENVGYLGDNDGFDWLVKDMHQLTGIIKKENPDKPVILFGHSMGSFLSQRYIQLYGDELKGVILSGSNGKQGLLLKVGKFVAKGEIKKIGKKGKSEKLNNMSFGSYNNSFKPVRTDFDWLSRDEKEVDKYINDPYCGGIFSAQFYFDFLTGLMEIEKNENIEKVPKNLPICIFSGALDPVGNQGKGVLKLIEAYKRHNITNIKYKLYEGGRHEMLNETNREEVMKDVVEWIDSQLS